MVQRKAKTDKQVKQEIKRLREIMPKVRKYSAFGDDNHEKIYAEIQALADKMDIEDTWIAWPEDEGPDGVMRDAAQYAINWRDGYEKESPSKGWEPLTRE